MRKQRTHNNQPIDSTLHSYKTPDTGTRLQRVRISWLTIGMIVGACATQLLSSQFSREVPTAHSSASPQINTPHSASPLPSENKGVGEEVVLHIEPEYPKTVNLVVGKGDVLTSLLINQKIPAEEARLAIKALKPVYNPKHIKYGQEITMELAANGADATVPTLASMTLKISKISNIHVEKEGDGYTAQQVDKPLRTTLIHGSGHINSSLYETGISHGMTPALLAELIKAYSYDVDFQRDIKRGNQLEVLFERKETEDGIIAGHGNLEYAALTIGGKTLKIYRYIDKEGFLDYYNEKGESVRKALLKTPINGARLSSGFGMRRHPVLGYNKMHKGLDFAAPRGTPIYAAGDGVVQRASRNGGYGNYVRIKHNGQYSSAYAHLKSFGKGIRAGKKVRQGDIIGYVGTTGRSTGPHLHYEILAHGKQVNPSNVKFKAGKELKGKELASFQKRMEIVHAKLDEARPEETKLAQAE